MAVQTHSAWINTAHRNHWEKLTEADDTLLITSAKQVSVEGGYEIIHAPGSKSLAIPCGLHVGRLQASRL